jgi:multiple sugar transport system substrate-binding protein
MNKQRWAGLAAGAVFALACGTASAAETLKILWAQWDPANYLQELVKDYEKQTGVKVTVETTPWPDFQTKAFREFAARGDAYDMVVGDSQWLGAGSTNGHYVDLTDFFKKHNVAKIMAPATVEGYAEYPKGSGKYWAIPLEATRPAGPTARTGSRIPRKRPRSRRSTAMTWPCPRPGRS